MFDFEAIKATTAAARYVKAPESTDSKEQKIADHISKSFGCNRNDVHKLVQLMLGAELPEPTAAISQGRRPDIGSAVQFKRHTVIIVSADSDGDRRFLTVRGNPEIGDSSYIQETDDWKYSTDAEIDRFASRFKLS